jgi:glutamyl-Q tRNA(Asp) synthetase
MIYRTRFAPSPTGPLHLGHAYSALIGYERAQARGGQFLLRIEDIDRERSKPHWEAAIEDDLHWLGITWHAPVLRQSERLEHYREALEKLSGLGLVYPCRCNRADIRAALAAPQEGAPVLGPDGLIYPGTCRGRHDPGPDDALRLDMEKAMALVGHVRFRETGTRHGGEYIKNPSQIIENIGDIVLARRGWGTSYHLSVVVDDAAQGITEVTRGEDLFDATPIHVLLQRLLDLPTPDYHHHALVRDEAGKRLAKRDEARALASFRAEGATPADIRALILRWAS